MRLWIANCTKQRQVVFYRLDFNADGQRNERSPPRSISVEAGRQAYLELKHPNQLGPIITQLAKVGACVVEDKNRLPQHLVPYILSTDAQVKPEVMLAVHKHNRLLLERSAKKRRERAAIAGSDVVQRAVDAQVKEFSAEIEQLPAENGEPEPQTKPVAEGYVVNTTADKSGGKGGSKKSGKDKSA